MAESGLVSYWVKRITPKNEICKVENRKAFSHDDDHRKILSLYDLSGPFILLITGSMVSLFVFLVEKIHHYYNLTTNLSVPPLMEVLEAHNVEIIDQLSVDGEKQGSSLKDTLDKLLTMIKISEFSIKFNFKLI